ncbi:phage baseplate protein [Pseudomonas proteolytica]|uniref:phage baseplate protein n=1 Tax=Pseudomonas proteolytica TaxID=219574 RepID=UPI0008967DA7|nr:hypothetical protein [Pseudomonas proteolytica]KAA8702463.1 hypothetical protein F4W61_11640 [Pseudomonas proteolytica]TWR76238.1 hypothetical protein FIV38_23965 [Pseudomonas proteolytica]SEE80159.1 hypothetical protein SAMN04490200_5511 [Pseudomonas proteolytica]
MSLMSIFAKTLPKIGTLEFDAKLEGSTDKAVYLTQYPVEFGAPANDHAILLPDHYLLVGAVSNSPLGLGLNDIGMMGAGALATAVGGIGGAAISAVSAYLLSGSEETKARTAWAALCAIRDSRSRLELDTGLEIMKDMVLIRLSQRTRPEDEDGLIFIAELQQLRTGSSTVGQGVQSADQLLPDVAAQAAPMVRTGEAALEVIA